MKSSNQSQPSGKKGLRLTNEKLVDRVERSTASFKSQIISEKDKLTANRQYHM